MSFEFRKPANFEYRATKVKKMLLEIFEIAPHMNLGILFLSSMFASFGNGDYRKKVFIWTFVGTSLLVTT